MRITLLVLLLFLVPAVSGLSLSPAKQIWNGEEFVITVGETTDVEFAVDGPYAKYFSIEQRADGNLVGSIDVDIDSLPPGDHDTLVVVQAIERDGQGFSAVVSLASVVTIRVPYDGPYLIANHFSESINETASSVTVTVENRGNVGASPSVVRIESEDNLVQLLPKVIPAFGATKFSTILTGKGLHDVVFFADDFIYVFPVEVGRPTIISVEAIPEPDASTILPIAITIDVDWNVPVGAIVRINEDEYNVVVNQSYQEKFYVENASDIVVVEVEVRGDVVRQELLTGDIVGPSESLPIGLILLVLVICSFIVVFIVYVFTKHRRR